MTVAKQLLKHLLSNESLYGVLRLGFNNCSYLAIINSQKKKQFFNEKNFNR